MIIPYSVSLRMRNVSNERYTENQNMHFMFNNFFFPKIVQFMRMWENNAEPDKPQITIPHMSIACKIAKATVTHSEYVTYCFSMVTVVS
jgi:hypothetical protein